MSWQRFRILRQIHARPRLMTATAVALVVAFLIPTTVAGHGVTRWLLAWNAGTLLYVLLAAVMMIRSSSHQMRRRAQLQDDGKIAILVLTTLAAVSDVSFVSKPLRRIGSLHCILAYLFNTTVLALLINIGAGIL